MKFFKSKKSKVLLTCLAVVLIASVLCATLVGCKPTRFGDTALGVYFVGDFQRAVKDLSAITKEGTEIVNIDYALEQAGAKDYKSNPAAAAAAIYATAVTNYNNVTQSAYYVVTDAKVQARDIRKALGTLSFDGFDVGIRSTFSSFNGKKGYFSQTVSGVIQLDGIGSLGDNLKSNFGYNIQSFHNDSLSAFRRGKNGGAQFPSVEEDENIYKYILGAYNKSLTETVKGNVTLTPYTKDTDELEAYVQPEGAMYHERSTLAGTPLPSFNPDRKAWEPLNRYPSRYKNDQGEIVLDFADVQNTVYAYGNYGAGFATYDFSRPQYLTNNTTVDYDKSLDLWIVTVDVKDEYANQACEFAGGTLVHDTKDYIQLKNASFQKISCKFEVYGNGLIKSMQKQDVLNSNDNCPLKVIPGECTGGGTSSNSATMAFSYSDYDTDAERLAALYWPELGQDKFFKDNKCDTNLKLNLSSYTTFNDYKPVVNDVLLGKFVNIFASDAGSGEAEN